MTDSLRVRVAALIVLAGGIGASTAIAQDSISTTNGLPGDAASAYTIGASQTQVLNYMVDTTVQTTSWGNTYRLAPLVKASASTSSGFFNHLIASQGVSNRFTPVGALPRASYRLWTTAGGGVNPLAGRNNLGTTIFTNSVQGHTFGVSFLEFAGGPNTVFGDGDDENNIIGVLASFDPLNPGRVYASRTVAATNRTNGSAGTFSNASFGLGGIDEAGNIAFYADGLSTNLGDDAITNKRYYRIASATRSSSVLNSIRGSASGDAARTSLLLGTTTALTAPTLISTNIAGRPVVLGLDFANSEQIEQSAGTMTSIATHLSASASLRGPMTFISRPFVLLTNGLSDAGTGIALSRLTSETKTRGLSIWGVNTSGTTDSTARFTLPLVATELIDPIDGFNPSNTFGSLGNHEFMNYQSQVCFRGPSGPVSGTVLPDGSLLLAAGVAATGGGATTPQSMDNYIAVARVDSTGNATWVVAAHTGGPTGAAGLLAKQILGPSGTPIGTLAKYNEAFPGATSGPSISPPAMDRLGNLYFLSTIMLNGTPNTFSTGLIRANRNSTTGGYQLELITKVGDVYAGANSARNYQIQFLGVADADSVDSGAVWPSSIVQDLPSTVANPTTLSYGSPRTLGAMVFRAKVVYDVNNDGLFIDPTQPVSASPDQAYNVLMVMLPGNEAVSRCSAADIAFDDGSPLPPVGIPGGTNNGVTEGDYNLFFANFFDALPVCDIANDDGSPLPPFGTLDTNNGVTEADYNLFFAIYFDGCPS
jgi:hypothetical protein